MLTAHFFFTFNDHFQIDRQFSACITPEFEGSCMDQYSCFIVRSAPTKKATIALGGLKRICLPKFTASLGLNIVMRIKKYGGKRSIDHMFGYDVGKTSIDLKLIHLLKSQPAKEIGGCFRALLDVFPLEAF